MVIIGKYNQRNKKEILKNPRRIIIQILIISLFLLLYIFGLSIIIEIFNFSKLGAMFIHISFLLSWFIYLIYTTTKKTMKDFEIIKLSKIILLFSIGLLLCGAFSNLLVIMSNGGLMPVYIDNAEHIKAIKDSEIHYAVFDINEPKFNLLIDRFNKGNTIISIGDIFIDIGAYILINLTIFYSVFGLITGVFIFIYSTKGLIKQKFKK